MTLGTAVIPVHPRHPTMLAAQALTVQAATGGRLALGIGLSHKMVVEGHVGLSPSIARPATWRSTSPSSCPCWPASRSPSRATSCGPTPSVRPRPRGPRAPPVLVAALGPVMLGIAARQASGTITWMVGLHDPGRPHRPHHHGGRGRRPGAPPRGGRHPARLRHRRPGRGPGTGRTDLLGLRPAPLLPGHARPRGGGRTPRRGHRRFARKRSRRPIGRFADAGATEFSAAAYGTPDEVARSQALLGTLACAAPYPEPTAPPLSGRSRCA